MKSFTHIKLDAADVLLSVALVCALTLMGGIVVAVQPLVA
jgi:hypothetical protein